ncbi:MULTISPECIES: hypothetical protein [unclassified Imperialibacter]|nr:MULTISPECIES: hypothetical protein [unclassified Imperialibacter]
MKTISFWCLSKRTLKGLASVSDFWNRLSGKIEVMSPTPSGSRDGDPKGILFQISLS